MRITILGAGAWGSVFGQILDDAGHDVCFWSLVQSELLAVKKAGFRSAPNIVTAVNPAQIVVVALPCAALRPVLKQLSAAELKSKTFVSLTKGIESVSLNFPSDILATILPLQPRQICALSGPNLAHELGQRLPAGAMIACSNLAVAQSLSDSFKTAYFRLWPTTDVRGVQVAGVYKNLLAIAIGLAQQQQLGNDFCALLATSGLAEMANFGRQIGAVDETFYGLAGVGDLLTTAYSDSSRNQTFGRLIAKHGSVKSATKAAASTIEGRYSVSSVVKIANNQAIKLPIAQLVDDLLSEKLNPTEFLLDLTKVLLK